MFRAGWGYVAERVGAGSGQRRIAGAQDGLHDRMRGDSYCDGIASGCNDVGNTGFSAENDGERARPECCSQLFQHSRYFRNSADIFPLGKMQYKRIICRPLLYGKNIPACCGVIEGCRQAINGFGGHCDQTTRAQRSRHPVYILRSWRQNLRQKFYGSTQLLHQQHIAGTLDGAGHVALFGSGHAGNAARENFSGVGNVAGELLDVGMFQIQWVDVSAFFAAFFSNHKRVKKVGFGELGKTNFLLSEIATALLPRHKHRNSKKTPWNIFSVALADDSSTTPLFSPSKLRFS